MQLPIDLSVVPSPEDRRILQDLVEALRDWRLKIRMMVCDIRIGTTTIRFFGDLEDIPGAGPPGCVPPLSRLSPARQTLVEMTRAIARGNWETAWREEHPEDLSRYATDVSGNPQPQWQATAPPRWPGDEPEAKESAERDDDPYGHPPDDDPPLDIAGWVARQAEQWAQIQATMEMLRTLPLPPDPAFGKFEIPKLEYDPNYVLPPLQFDNIGVPTPEQILAAAAAAPMSFSPSHLPTKPDFPPAIKGETLDASKIVHDHPWWSLGLISSAEAQTVPIAEPVEPVEPIESDPPPPENRHVEEDYSPKEIIIRWADYNYEIRELQKIDPTNQQLETAHSPEWIPRVRDIQRLKDEVIAVNKRASERTYGRIAADPIRRNPSFDAWANRTAESFGDLAPTAPPVADPTLNVTTPNVAEPAVPQERTDLPSLPEGYYYRANGSNVQIVRHDAETLPRLGLTDEGDLYSPVEIASGHGNSVNSILPATLYQLYTDDGEFLKWGVSQDIDSRYSGDFMLDKAIFPCATGSRIDMLKLERQLVETKPGPLNLEPWAGAGKKP